MAAFASSSRWPECHDYSEVIRDWASNPKRQMGPFTTSRMEETTIADLSVRFGFPYVYVHQVGCRIPERRAGCLIAERENWLSNESSLLLLCHRLMKTLAGSSRLCVYELPSLFS